MATTTDEPVQVLHVDDSSGLGDLVQHYLEAGESGLRCEVTTETAPRDALERIRGSETAFDCVVTDYRMPGMTGIELLDAIRETEPTLPVLLFSREETDSVAAEIISAGLSDYLQKGYGTEPYTMLIRRVEHAVHSEGQFDASVEAELDGVGIIGPDERFERVDELYASVYGYEPDEIVGKHWTELHPDSEVDHVRSNVLPVVREGGKWEGRSEGLRADGDTFTESKLVTALDDERLLIAVSDIDQTGSVSGD
ncbi:response regulator [Haloarcula salinisoli]|uniref:Response regulator n=1 Tax=Haloarcula salinisoli TaxID=2487746 RepID=A0A8J7YKM0_9EURY|nr:response regulator [Halomicroarcula salinisoli]MBX0287370.1 response regulator [Halomicroarcula salinisoli]MBX0305056.1 response regulator [Halomicroarcula salinisoli]